MPCKSDGFSLTSGDFPTLGSEKESVGKDAESQGSCLCVTWTQFILPLKYYILYF